MNAFAAFPATDSHPSSGLVAGAPVGILWLEADAAAAVDVDDDAAAQGPQVAVYIEVFYSPSTTNTRLHPSLSMLVDVSAVSMYSY